MEHRVAVAHRPVGIIDWHFARSAPRLHDVAYALEYVAPFRSDADCLRWLHFPEPPDPVGVWSCPVLPMLPKASGMVDAVIARQQENIEFVRWLAGQGHEPQATWVAERVLQERESRVVWSQSNRILFES
ncbi:hypothetical protein ACFV0T_38140 [Streptomyces sp. NPDC059582]|uniref:hypothetical protein n=1 Tax=Streptomyces sp. NPDC059582 TaxID=3346875 RepID=UPI0036A9E2C9